MNKSNLEEQIREILKEMVEEDVQELRNEEVMYKDRTNQILALLASHDQELVERVIGEDEAETIPKLRDMPIEEAIIRNQLRKEQRARVSKGMEKR